MIRGLSAVMESNEGEKEETGFQKTFSDGRMGMKFEKVRVSSHVHSIQF